jgi:hypothetical protein
MDFETEIKPALVNMMINIRDKEYTDEEEKHKDLNYNLALSEALVKLKDTNDFLRNAKELAKVLKI